MASDQQRDLVPGALVEWDSQKAAYGVVTSNDGHRIQVQWDDSGIPAEFAAANPPISLVRLTSRPVQRRSTGEYVAVLSPMAVAVPTWQCQVFPRSGGMPSTVSIPEADLRPVPVTDPLERFRAGEIGTTRRYLIRQVAEQYRHQNLHDDLVSLGQSQVDIQPHQVSVVHKVISNYPHRFLLCDEVGLGKTIEAGMALKELRARAGVRRVLAIVPPNLVSQWQFEMRTKFNEPFSVLNTPTVNRMREDGYHGNPFAHADYSSVLCSSRWVTNARWRDSCAEAYWDLIILDEAHHARSHQGGGSTALYNLIHRLATQENTHYRGMLFLTATPMQLHPHELYSLVELLDPTLFPSEEDFNQHRRETPGLSRLAESLTRHGFPIPDQDEAQTIQQVSQWLDLDFDETKRRLSSGQDELQDVIEKLSDKHRLSEVLIRNRKAMVGGFMPRSAYRWEVDLSAEEQAALQAVEDYVRFGYQFAEDTNANAIGFLMVTFQKLAASSIAAIRESLLRRREKVQARAIAGQSLTQGEMEDLLDDDENAGAIAGKSAVAAEMTQRELTLLDNAIAAIDNVGETDSKARVLLERLGDLFKDNPEEKVIVFTQFRETLSHLENLFTTRGWGVNVFHGQMGPGQKDRAIENFRKDSGAQVLICTEAGGEGRNLQFCHLLVNYDLPWNPMKVEQRIGRVDRIGQNKPINVFNLWVKDTVEERVLDILENRIKMFTDTVGELDPILGDSDNIESDIRKILQTAEENRAATLADFDRQNEARIRASEEAQERLGDFIMDTKSFRQEIARRISGQDSPIDHDNFERFIWNMLSEVKTQINRRSGEIYDLTFHGDFLQDHQRELFVGGPRMRAVLRPDRRPDSENVEFMVFGHKVVDTIVAQVLAANYDGNAGTRRIVAGDDLAPTSGWLFQYQFTVPGVRNTEHLEAVFVSDAGEISTEIGHKLVQRACRFDKEKWIDLNRIPDNLDQISPIASEFANRRQQAIQSDAAAQASGRSGREISRLEEFYDYKEQAAGDKVTATRATIQRIRESGSQSQQQILPVWEANLRRDEAIVANLADERRRRIGEIEAHRSPQVSWTLKSMGRIEVVADE